VKYKVSETLAFTRHQDAIVGCNFLRKTTFECDHSVLEGITRLDGWHDVAEIGRAFEIAGRKDADALVGSLHEAGILVRRGSDEAKRDESFAKAWEWGIPAALMHFCVQDNPIVSVAEVEQIQLHKIESTRQPALMKTHGNSRCRIRLPLEMENNDLLSLMAKRRTRREVKKTPVTLDAVSDCLFAGLGITGETQNCAGSLPLSMTPSGGARNPYEAFVLARNVEGLEPGMYHYSGLEHTLLPVDAKPKYGAAELAGDQPWLDDMACVVFLCAYFERTMWKYEDPNAYRVVMIEAGHIGQNIMLAATSHGLTACPTAALCHTKISALCGLDDPVMQTPVYALAIGEPEEIPPLSTSSRNG
jgi:SagB-type dehydrogenase family enzyme